MIFNYSLYHQTLDLYYLYYSNKAWINLAAFKYYLFIPTFHDWSTLIYFKSIVKFDGENYKHISLPPPRLKASPSCAIDRIERSDWSCFVFPTTDGCWVTKAVVRTVCDSPRITRVISAKTLTPRNFSTKWNHFRYYLYFYAIPLRAAREKSPL